MRPAGADLLIGPLAQAALLEVLGGGTGQLPMGLDEGLQLLDPLEHHGRLGGHARSRSGGLVGPPPRQLVLGADADGAVDQSRDRRVRDRAAGVLVRPDGQ